MQQQLIGQAAPKTNKNKIAIIALVGTVAVIGTVLLCFAAPAPKQIALVEGVDTMIQDAFHKWTAKYNKLYLSEEETVYRMKVFQENFYKVKKIQDKGIKSYTVGLNKFSDLTKEEFRAQYLNRQGEPAKNWPVEDQPKSNEDQVDWRKKGAVSPVKNQGFCGSCWAFSAVGSIESLHFIKTGKLDRFSEQQLVDCDKGTNQGCNGGFEYLGMDYVAKKGIELESDYKYTAQDGKCKYDEKKVAYRISGYAMVTPENSDKLADSVTTQPTAVAVQADSDDFMFYTGGIVDSEDCGTMLNHAILAVGFDAKADTPYWIVKNSWGEDWGEDGYIRIFKDTKKGKGICGIAAEPSYPKA